MIERCGCRRTRKQAMAEKAPLMDEVSLEEPSDKKRDASTEVVSCASSISTTLVLPVEG